MLPAKLRDKLLTSWGEDFPWPPVHVLPVGRQDHRYRQDRRYDTAHGFPPRDLLHPNRPEEKTEYPGRSNAEVLTLGQEDIKRNWRTYRAQYEKEMGK
ncbi:MAG: hypothetical protein U9Q78_02720 [Chloroflexota bacterium]|nr:hypothetical protein [Chloroflexota bacterium]